MPEAQGSSALAPPILSMLPKKSMDGQTTHYALGAAGYAGSGGVLPPELVGFDRDAEAVTANYSLTSGPAVLTLIDYPTPQMAAAYETKIRDYIKAGSKAQPAFPKPLVDSDQASLEVRRSGPVVALVSGDAIPDESHKLLESVSLPGGLRFDSAAGRVGGVEDRAAADGDCDAGADRRRRGDLAGGFLRRRTGALPHRERQAGFLGVRSGVHQPRSAGVMLARVTLGSELVRIRRVNRAEQACGKRGRNSRKHPGNPRKTETKKANKETKTGLRWKAVACL